MIHNYLHLKCLISVKLITKFWYTENNIHVMIIPRVCAHTSPIHPNGEKVAKRSPICWEKNNFPGKGGSERLLLPPPPPAMVGGKSRPSTPPWKTIERLFATFSPAGGGGLFYHMRAFLLRFPLLGGRFHHVGVLFATFSPYAGPFSPCHFAIFFYVGVFLLRFSPRGWGIFAPWEGLYYYVFPLMGCLSATFSLCGWSFSYYRGPFLGFPLPTIRLRNYLRTPMPPLPLRALKPTHPPSRLRAPKPSLSPMRAPKPGPPPAGARHLRSPPTPPPTISKTIVSISTISYMWFLPGVFGMIQLEFFKNSRCWPFYSDLKIKSSENSCKNNIFVILFKIDFKCTKRRGIWKRI